MTNQIAELTSSGSSRSWSGSEQKCHQTGACVPIVTAASAGCYFSQLWSGASSSDLHRAGPVTPGGSNHVPLSGAALIGLSNFTGRDWGRTGQGLSVARAPCARSFSPGHLVLASRPLGRDGQAPVGSWPVPHGASCWRLAPVRGLLEGRWGESPMEIEIFRAEAAHGHTDLPRFAVRSGSLGRIAPPYSRFHSHRELPCIARTEDCRNGQFCATSGVGGCRGRSGELVAGTGLGKVCVRSCCRPSDVITFLGHHGSGPGTRQPLIGTWSHSWLATGQTASGRRMDAMNSLCGQES